jgi:hypothetical protein
MFQALFAHHQEALLTQGKGHPITSHPGPRGGGEGAEVRIVLFILDLGARKGWMVRCILPNREPHMLHSATRVVAVLNGYSTHKTNHAHNTS